MQLCPLAPYYLCPVVVFRVKTGKLTYEFTPNRKRPGQPGRFFSPKFD